MKRYALIYPNIYDISNRIEDSPLFSRMFCWVGGGNVTILRDSDDLKVTIKHYLKAIYSELLDLDSDYA